MSSLSDGVLEIGKPGAMLSPSSWWTTEPLRRDASRVSRLWLDHVSYTRLGCLFEVHRVALRCASSPHHRVARPACTSTTSPQMRRAQSVRNHARPSLALGADDLGVLKEDESVEGVLRKQLLDKDRECDRVRTHCRSARVTREVTVITATNPDTNAAGSAGPASTTREGPGPGEGVHEPGAHPSGHTTRERAMHGGA